MSEHPNIWTDGSREDFSSVGGFEVAGAGVHMPAPEVAFDYLVWRTAEEYGDARLERCRAFLPVPGVMQTVQRAEFWGAVIALQSYWPCLSGIDNLDVARSIGRLLDCDCLTKPLPLVKDGDLVAIAQCMIRTRGQGTVRVTEVKGRATDDDVEHGRVRLADKVGNAEADAAADLGRRHQSEVLIDARRTLLKARSYWYPKTAWVYDCCCLGGAVLPLIRLSGIRVVLRKLTSLLLGLMLILPLFLALLVSWVGPGFKFMVVTFLVLMLLPGLTVLVSCVGLPLSLVSCIGQRVPMRLVILEFLFFCSSDPF